MALIKCKECGKEISDKAKRCPNCGAFAFAKDANLFKILGKNIVNIVSKIAKKVSPAKGDANKKARGFELAKDYEDSYEGIQVEIVDSPIDDEANTNIEVPDVKKDEEINDKQNQFIKLALNAYGHYPVGEDSRWLFDNYPHYHFFFWLANRQIPYERAWDIPQKIVAILGGYSFELFCGHNREWWINLFVKNKLHRFNKNIGDCYYEAIEKIESEYHGDVRNIWNDTPSAKTLVKRLEEFNGIGQKIANSFVIALIRDFKVELSSYENLEIAVDVNVKKVFVRMEFVDIDISQINTADKQIFIDAAKRIYPQEPWKLDLLAWSVGQEFCHPDMTKCKCDSCTLVKICPSNKKVKIGNCETDNKNTIDPFKITKTQTIAISDELRDMDKKARHFKKIAKDGVGEYGNTTLTRIQGQASGKDIRLIHKKGYDARIALPFPDDSIPQIYPDQHTTRDCYYIQRQPYLGIKDGGIVEMISHYDPAKRTQDEWLDNTYNIYNVEGKFIAQYIIKSCNSKSVTIYPSEHSVTNLENPTNRLTTSQELPQIKKIHTPEDCVQNCLST